MFKSAGVIVRVLALICSIFCVFHTNKSLAQGEFPNPIQMTFDQAGYRPNNVYAPQPIYQYINGVKTLVLYFGGWYATDPTTLPHDSIYRAVCSSPSSCGPAEKVIDPVAAGMQSASLLNNPAIVEVHYNGQDYFIMYMTGINSTDPNAGYTLSNNKIYYSTSWAYDGINWSAPQLLFDGFWLPSATINAQGHVILYANSTSNTNLYQIDLNTNGAWYNGIQLVNTPYSLPYFNVNVVYRSDINLYQILGRVGDNNTDNTCVNGNCEIDYMDSSDGVNWVLRAARVASGDTSAAHPDTDCWAYYGFFQNGGANVFLKSWC